MAISKAGLHARPAAVFVKAVQNWAPGALIGRPGGDAVQARSIVSVLALDIQPGESVVLTGPDADSLDKLAALLETEEDK